MKLGGPIHRDNSGKYVGQRVGSKDINEDTLMIGSKKRTLSQKIGRFYDRCVEMVLHPQAFYKENKRFKRMIRGEEEWDREVLDKRISERKVGLTPGFDDVQTGLKKVNETARKKQGMREDVEAYEYERVRALRLANEQGDMVRPMKVDEEYLNETKAIRSGIEQEKLGQKKRNAELSELYAPEFGEKDSKISKLQEEVAEHRDTFRRWAKRKYALPWYSSKEKAVHREFEGREGAFGQPMTRKAINAEIRRTEERYYRVRTALAKKQEERGKLHDQKRHPKAQMDIVNKELKSFENDIAGSFKEAYGNLNDFVKAELPAGAGDRIYAGMVIEKISDFRAQTGVLEKALQDPSKLSGKTETDIKEMYTELAAHRIAGNALYRMQMMSKTREGFEGRINNYLKGDPDPEEVKMVHKASGRELYTGYGSSVGGVSLAEQVEPGQEVASRDSMNPVESGSQSGAPVGDLLGDFDPLSSASPRSGSHTGSSVDDLLSLNEDEIGKEPSASGDNNKSE